ncbi:unnamed protein product, partial [marine sediment metagenome]
IQYICFSDQLIKCPPWKIIYIKPKFKDGRREARKFKILPHIYLKDFKYSLWVDGSYEILDDLSKYVKKWLGKNYIAVKNHSVRHCLYDEARFCMKQKLDSRKLIVKQINKYFREGYPKNNGLVETGFLIRQHTEDVKRFNERWWREVKHFSRRDQISFNYITYKLNMNCSIISKNEIKRTLNWRGHNKVLMHRYLNFNDRIYHYVIRFYIILQMVRYFYNKQAVNHLKIYYKEIKYNLLGKKIHLPKIISYFIQLIYKYI